MSKFNVGDKIRIIGWVASEDFRKSYNSHYGPHIGEITIVTKVLSLPWTDLTHIYHVESNECAWPENELEFVNDDFDIEEESIIKLFQPEGMK